MRFIHLLFKCAIKIVISGSTSVNKCPSIPILLLLVPADPMSHLGEGFQLLWRDQLKFLYKVVEMLVASVDVGLRPYAYDPVKVMYVDVHENAE